MKPIAIFVWWLSNRANRIELQDRAELRRRVEAAARGGRPVLFASNHLSMFDDPVLPMALYRLGFRAVAELSALTALLVACWVVPGEIGPARRGIGDIVVRLRERGLDPLVIAVRHRGLEHVIPRGSTRGITSGHLIEACWAECQLDREGSDGRDQDAQSIADAVRSRVASLMPGKPPQRPEGG